MTEAPTIVLSGPTPPDEALHGVIASLRAISPLSRVIIEPYEDARELRLARTGSNPDSVRDVMPALTASQRSSFAEATVILALDLPFDMATVAPNLKWVHGLGAGTGQLQTCGLFEAGITLTSSAGASADAIAEFVMARLLQHVKFLRALDDQQRDHRWRPKFGRSLIGLNIALVGFGAINQKVAVLAGAFGMRVNACYRSAAGGDQRPGVDAVFASSELQTMLAAADVVVFALPETAETIGLVTRELLEGMRPGAILCNVGRGSLIDEAALVGALTSGHLGAALLDVSVREPLDDDDALWDAPNMYYSPHCSVVLDQMFTNVYALFAENLRRFVNAEPMLNVVTPDKGY
jgi:phosphoglycerate dehydrogenase-like enzyme